MYLSLQLNTIHDPIELSLKKKKEVTYFILYSRTSGICSK